MHTFKTKFQQPVIPAFMVSKSTALTRSPNSVVGVAHVEEAEQTWREGTCVLIQGGTCALRRCGMAVFQW